MKITYVSYEAVAAWRWNIATSADKDTLDDDDEVCGICRVAFEGACPECAVPGDDCPLIFGKCTHIFHMHCLIRWLQTDQSKGCCPMDRTEWVTAEQSMAPPPE